MISIRPGSVVYAIGSPANGLVKIGKAQSLAKRFRDIQAMCPVQLEVLWYTSGGQPLEAKLHRVFKARRAHGEWFDFSGVEVAPLLDKAAQSRRFDGPEQAVQLAASALDATRAAIAQPDSRTLNDVWHFGDVLYGICNDLAWSLVTHTRTLHRLNSCWDELLWSEVESTAMKLADAIGKTRPKAWEDEAATNLTEERT